MEPTIVVAWITAGASILVGIITLVGVIYSNRKAHQHMLDEIKMSQAVSQAVTDTKIEELTREVRKHNDFATRIPTVENEIKNLHYRINELKEEKS